MDHNQGRIAHVETIIKGLLQDMHHRASPELQEVLASIPVRVHWDSPEHDRYGDFFGVPLDEGDGGASVAADIIIYAKPLWDECRGDEQELHRMTKVTLMHEIGHYLGLNHEELKERGWD